MTTESAAPAADDKLKQPPAEAESGAEPQQTEEEKLWNELPDDGAEPDKKVNGEEVSHDFGAETETGSTESKEDGKDDASAGADDKAGDAAKSTEQPAASSPKDDIWANASPELRAAHEAEMAALRKATNDAKAQAGRMRKQYEELRKSSADRAADDQGSKKAGDILKEGLAEYPEIAKPVEDALAPIAKQLDELNASQKRTNDALNAEVISHIRSQQELLDAAHPDWQEYAQDPGKSPKSKVFYDWILDQPKRLRDIVFDTNLEHIFDGQGAIEVMDAFKAQLAAAENPTPGDGQTQELSAKRAAQLEGTRSPRTPGGPPRVTGIPREGDPQAIWDAFGDDNADDRLLRGKRA